jgi:hypothetical protein
LEFGAWLLVIVFYFGYTCYKYIFVLKEIEGIKAGVSTVDSVGIIID